MELTVPLQIRKLTSLDDVAENNLSIYSPLPKNWAGTLQMFDSMNTSEDAIFSQNTFTTIMETLLGSNCGERFVAAQLKERLVTL